MGQRQIKNKRKIEKLMYKVQYYSWISSKPKWWHFIQIRKWKASEPKPTRLARTAKKEVKENERQN